ncbi:hypothetical protein AAY473_038813 [Plecturocebus cupreus]
MSDGLGQGHSGDRGTTEAFAVVQLGGDRVLSWENRKGEEATDGVERDWGDIVDRIWQLILHVHTQDLTMSPRLASSDPPALASQSAEITGMRKLILESGLSAIAAKWAFQIWDKPPGFWQQGGVLSENVKTARHTSALPLLSANHMLPLLLAASWGMAFFPFSKPPKMS